MKDQVKTPVIVVAVVALVAVLLFFGSKAMGAGDLDQGQVKYTPGKPPWDDPLQKGNNNGRAPSPSAAPASGATALPDAHAPAGMSAPKVGNGP